MQAPEVFFLSSLESYRFKPVRTCRMVREVVFDTGKVGMVVRLEPPVLGQEFNSGVDLNRFVLSTRFVGESISPISSFPCFVHIALPIPGWNDTAETVSATDLQVVGWGELYRTADDAAAHKFE